jgi:serine phosphatase RsbU (regulator of sigma subunit)
MTVSSIPSSLHGPPIIEWGWAGRALDGTSGDLHVVVEFDDGAVVALLDGLGHGIEASDAVIAAAPVIEAYAHEPVLAIVQRCHEALRGTRGAVMTIASFEGAGASMTWAGVGNVDGVLLRAPGATDRQNRGISTRGGVVGYRLPPLHDERVTVAPGDTLVMVSDGIQSSFTVSLSTQLSPQELAESILIRYGKGTDDAHVVVARYLGVAR